MNNEYYGGISTIAERYAEALIKLGDEKTLLDQFDKDFQLIKETISGCKDLSDFLEHPEITIIDKKEIIETVFKENISEYTLNTLKLLIDRNRMFIIAALAAIYHKQLNKKKNIIEAEVIAAIELEQDVLNKIKEKLEVVYKKTLEISFKVDKKIIAGVVVKVENEVIDGSIKNRINKMKNQFI